MDRENRRLFVGCRSKHLAVLDAENGKVVFIAPIGEHVDATAFDPRTRMVYLSTGDGKVFVFHQDSADKYSQVQEIATKTGAKTMRFEVAAILLRYACFERNVHLMEECLYTPIPPAVRVAMRACSAVCKLPFAFAGCS